MPVKKSTKEKKATQELESIEEAINIRQDGNILVKTFPEERNFSKTSLTSYQHGKPNLFENFQLPKGIKLKQNPPCNTQKTTEEKVEKKKISKNDGPAELINNLRAILRS